MTASPSPGWALAFERACLGSGTAPLISPDQTLIGACEAVFTFDAGEYRGELPIGARAFLDSTLVIADSLGGQGVELAPILGGDPKRERVLGRGSGDGTIVSPDGKQALSVLERRDHGAVVSVVLLSLPSLAVRAELTLPATAAADVAFDADGTPFVVANDECTTSADGRATCASRRLSRFEAGGLVSVPAAPRDLHAVRFARRAARAIVVHQNGRRAVVALPSWTEVVALPDVGDDDTWPESTVAISSDGARVVYLDAGDLVIADVDIGTRNERYRRTYPDAEGFELSGDGKSVLARTVGSVAMIREGARASRTAAGPAPQIFPPPGFALTWRRGGAADRAEEGGGLLPFGAVERYRSEDDGMLTVSVLDPRELGTADTPFDVWLSRVRIRHADADASELRRWTKPSGRGVELAWFQRHGCDHADHYLRIEERDGVLHVIDLEVAPGTSNAVLGPLLHVLFDRPTDDGAAPRRLVAAAPASRGCGGTRIPPP